MVTFAITLSDLIEKGGSYAGLAAFFGLAVLTILYFAQAREVRRLREWAGRAPERAQELEERVVQQADTARNVVAEPIRWPGQPAAKPATAAAAVAQAASTLPPAASETTRADAAADAKPPAEEGSPTENPVIGVAAPATPAPAEAEPATTGDEEEAKPAPEREAVPAGLVAGTAAPEATEGGSTSSPSLPPRATKGPPGAPVPPARRPAPAARPLRASAPATRRPEVPPRRPVPPPLGRDETPNRLRTGILAAGALAGVTLLVVGLIALLGGRDDASSANTSTTTTPATETAVGGNDGNGGADPTPAPGSPERSETSIAVLNGTTITGLAARLNEELIQAGYVAAQEATDWTDSARSASVVFYASSEFRNQAIDVAEQLGIEDLQATIEEATALAPEADVIVLVGSDSAP
ncbi:MAG: LytR C-terminal domain-containing protein [Solirubrobacteraceae bacterium]